MLYQFHWRYQSQLTSVSNFQLTRMKKYRLHSVLITFLKIIFQMSEGQYENVDRTHRIFFMFCFDSMRGGAIGWLPYHFDFRAPLKEILCMAQCPCTKYPRPTSGRVGIAYYFYLLAGFDFLCYHFSY